MNDTTRELGGALGVAVLGSIVASRYSSRLAPLLHSVPAASRGAAAKSVSAAVSVGHSLGGSEGVTLATAARHAYVSGMALATIVAACIALLASVIVYRLLPGRNR